MAGLIINLNFFLSIASYLYTLYNKLLSAAARAVVAKVVAKAVASCISRLLQ